MKNLIYLICVILLSSCATTLPQLNVINPSETLYGIDFSPFTKKGFLITPEKYTGPYESIGMITFTAKPGAKYVKAGAKANRYYSEWSGDPEYFEIFEWKVDTIIFSEVLTRVYDICVSMGADALVNFQNEVIMEPHEGISNPVTIAGYRISGYAIKRGEKR